MVSLELDMFKPVENSDKGIITNFYETYPPNHSDYSFSTMLSWQEYMKYFYCIVDNALIIMTHQDDKVRFRPPQGEPSDELDKQVLGLAMREGSEIPYGVVEVDAKNRVSNKFPNLVFEEHRDFFDYVYLAKDLEELKGKKFLNIRNVLNRFHRRYDASVEPINPENISEVGRFLERWCLWKDCDKIPLLKSEKAAVLYSIKHFFELELAGIAIRIDGSIEAASIFTTLNKETAVIHFEKAIPDFDGLYQVINQEAARVLGNTFKFINREGDMGFPGLRQAKLKYQPHHMVEVYHVSKEQLKKNLIH